MGKIENYQNNRSDRYTNDRNERTHTGITLGAILFALSHDWPMAIWRIINPQDVNCAKQGGTHRGT